MGGADAEGNSYMHEECFTFKQQRMLGEVGTTAKNKNGKRELMSVEQANMWRDISATRRRRCMEGLQRQKERRICLKGLNNQKKRRRPRTR